MKNILIFLALFSTVLHPHAWAGSSEETLSHMLNEFLAGASVNDPAAHERFWADDLVYTSSQGLRFGKREILEGMSSDAIAEEQEPEVVYSAEDVRIRQYGDTAVVAFRLLGASQDDSGEVREYLNTGTFVKRNDEWRVVAWQATAIPDSD